jgi:hypothetical protein
VSQISFGVPPSMDIVTSLDMLPMVPTKRLSGDQNRALTMFVGARYLTNGVSKRRTQIPEAPVVSAAT